MYFLPLKRCVYETLHSDCRSPYLYPNFHLRPCCFPSQAQFSLYCFFLHENMQTQTPDPTRNRICRCQCHFQILQILQRNCDVLPTQSLLKSLNPQNNILSRNLKTLLLGRSFKQGLLLL